jgi:uncharacterized protein
MAPWVQDVLFVLIGLNAGFLSGLLGIGGGIIVVPLLSWLLLYTPLDRAIIMHVTISTSLAIMMFTTQAGLRTHHRQGHVDPQLLKRLLPGVVVGAVTGAILAKYLSTHVLEILFAIFLILMGTRMLFLIAPKPHHKLPGRLGLSVVSWVVGAKSGLLGLGGGAITIPFLTRCNVSLRDAVGMSSALSFTIACIGTLTAIVTGYHDPHIPPYSTGYIHWPAVLLVSIPSMIAARFGAHCSYRVQGHKLQRVFAIILFLMAFHILWR